MYISLPTVTRTRCWYKGDIHFSSLFSWTWEDCNSDNCSLAEPKANQNRHGRKWKGINQGKRWSWDRQTFWLLGRAARLQQGQLQYEAWLSPLESRVTDKAALGRSGGCLCLSCSVLHNTVSFFFLNGLKSFLFFHWGLIITAMCLQFVSSNFTGWSCEEEVELGKLLRRGGFECWCNMPCLSIQVVTISAVRRV